MSFISQFVTAPYKLSFVLDSLLTQTRNLTRTARAGWQRSSTAITLASSPCAASAARAPDMCYSLDPKTGVWEAVELSASEVKEPNFLQLRDARMAALNKMGIPAKLVRAMHRPNTVLEDWSIEGITGKCPSARGGWLYEIVKDKVYGYGGWEGEGKTRVYLDDLYSLDM